METIFRFHRLCRRSRDLLLCVRPPDFFEFFLFFEVPFDVVSAFPSLADSPALPFVFLLFSFLLPLSVEVSVVSFFGVEFRCLFLAGSLQAQPV